MDIRPHHLFCTLLYTGNGYSEEFCNNMDKIVSKLKQNLNINICIKADDICEYCPNNENDLCKYGNHDIIKRDERVLKALAIKEGIYNYADLNAKMYTSIDENAFNKICGNCRWGNIGLCSYIELKKRIKF